MNYYGYRTCGFNPVNAWLNAHAKAVGWLGSVGFGLVFWTILILWLTE